MNELKPCPFCGGERVSFVDAVSGSFVRCATCGSESKLGTTIREAADAWNMRAGDKPERMTVNVGEVAVFSSAKADKEQALKIVEEAAEVFGAWQTWTDDDACINDREAIASECADVIQAVANMLHAIGVDDATLAMGECRRRNEERGRF